MPSYPQLRFTALLTPPYWYGTINVMTKPKVPPIGKGKYNRDSVKLVRRWQICLAIAQAHNKSKFTNEQLMLIKENLEKQIYLI